MSSHTYGHYPCKRQNYPCVTYRTDFRAGRIDFQIRNYGLQPVKVRIEEAEVDGSFPANVVDDTLIMPGGGVVDLAINSAKGLVRILSGSGNENNGGIYVQAQFLGHTFYGGNLYDMESLDRYGFYGGTDIPRGVRD